MLSRGGIALGYGWCCRNERRPSAGWDLAVVRRAPRRGRPQPALGRRCCRTRHPGLDPGSRFLAGVGRRRSGTPGQARGDVRVRWWGSSSASGAAGRGRGRRRWWRRP
ncbi:hypothetical protein CA237_16390 [Sphingomonas sp. ABOLH]|nr:MAG: hypothetical protein DI625_16035 [Sphingomonas sp.]RSV21440.1 hypothetical protein CA237_16390 [Sphingomonas sp. ABOLH]